MFHAIAKVMQSSLSEIVQIVLNANNKIHASHITRLYKNLHKILYYGFSLLDTFTQKKFFGASARNIINLEELVGRNTNIPVIFADVARKKYTDEISDTTLQEISAVEPDVIIRFGFRILTGKIFNVAPMGVWSYHHGDPNIFRGGPACFWEVVEQKPLTGLILQKINDELDGGEILKQRFISTAKFSPAQNYEIALWSSVNFIEQALRNYEHRSKPELKFLPFDRSLCKAPSNIKFLKIFAVLSFRIFYRSMQKFLYQDQWVLYANTSTSNRMQNYQQLLPPKDRFWADPFIIKRDGKHWIFFEELLNERNAAHISVGELKDTGLANIKPAVVENYHLSYPHLMEIGTQLYMIPESSANKSIDLYICEDFPYSWRKVKSLQSDVTAVDTNIFYFNGYWWLFTCTKEFPGECPHSSLNIFWTKDILQGKWIAHSMNPVVSNARYARAGGRVIQENGNLYRVVQDCSVRYGYKLMINRVELLTVDNFKEVTIDTFGPHWQRRTWATHTYNKCEDATVIDALQSRRRFLDW